MKLAASMFFGVFAVTLSFALHAEPPRKAITDPANYNDLPSLGITKQQATAKLDEHSKLALRPSLLPGVDTWWAQSDGEQIVLSLKMVRDKIVAAVIDVPARPNSDELLVKRTAFAIRALANLDPAGEWATTRARAIGGVIARVSEPPYEPFGGKTGNNYVTFQYFPARNAVQISVLPIRLLKEYELADL